MNDTITLTGFVARPPHQRGMSGNSPVISFRLLSSQSHFDRAKSIWIDDDPNWYTVSAFRQLALNVLKSVGKGDRVIVTGRLRIHDWEASGRSGTNIDLNADAIGHDLCFRQTVIHSRRREHCDHAGLGRGIRHGKPAVGRQSAGGESRCRGGPE